jgi:hypothetical protein
MRPDEINTWLKHGRKLHAVPKVSLEEFSAAWKKWWAHLQPEWRGEGPDFSYDLPEDAQWPELQKGGSNGFYLLLLSYGWWGAATTDDNDVPIEPQYSEWKDSFLDIVWVLDQMVSGLALQSRKRAREEEEENGVSKRVSKRFVSVTYLAVPLDNRYSTG